MPKADAIRATSAAYPDGPLPAALDGRARFRELFCAEAAKSDGPPAAAGHCDDLLWRLRDEPAAPPTPARQPAIAGNLRIFVISGAFGDCRIEDMFPFGDEIERLVARGVQIVPIKVSGRSSASANARQIADVVAAAGVREDERIALIGYSKGAVDSLHFLIEHPDRARQVAAVVSVAGPIRGSPLAGRADWWYREVFAQSFAGFCSPGDGGVIDSLLPRTRIAWLAAHPLPTNVRYFSVAGFTTREHLSRGLSTTWRMLAEDDRRNDGQVLPVDAVIPGGDLLGYVNTDHWDLAIGLEKQLPLLSARPTDRAFPRGALLEAMLLYVSEALGPGAGSPH